MGGSAFPALSVPRLSSERYAQLRDHYIARLQPFFHDITCPRLAPEKADHGDVDIYVCRPKQELDRDRIGQAIGAVAKAGHGPTYSYAVPLPFSKDQHAQIDVHVCRDGYFEWETFMSSYGDLTQIIGTLNRRIGLTMTDRGLHLRVAEVEPINRARSMILLTCEPREVMRFLGLDAEAWFAGFATEQDVFAWCAAGRYYGAPDGTLESANDRARLQVRPMYSRFALEWAPQHRDRWRAQSHDRARVLADAVARFHVQPQIDEALRFYKTKTRQRSLSEAVREHIPAGKVGQRQIMRGIKRWVVLHDGHWHLAPEDQARDLQAAPSSPDWFASMTDDDAVTLIEWLKTHYEVIRGMEARRA